METEGGKIAIEAAQWLNDNGVPTTLHIIGGRDIDNASLATKNIDYIGMLDKNLPKDYKKLIEELRRDQVLIFPTQAECTGIVTCEACAFGLPVYGSDTGGVGSYITDGENGRLLPLGSKGKDYGMKIKQDLLSGKLEEMSALARKRYEEDLNWNTFGGKIASLINNYL